MQNNTEHSDSSHITTTSSTHVQDSEHILKPTGETLPTNDIHGTIHYSDVHISDSLPTHKPQLDLDNGE